MGISRTLGASLLTAALVWGPVAAAVASPAPEAVTAGAADHLVTDSNKQAIIDVFDGISAFRASKGLEPLKFNTVISKISQRWSNHMATANTFYHNPDYVTAAADDWRGASENIAARWDRSGQELVNQWINSPPHNANMSTPGWQLIGIGVSYSDNNDGRYPTYSTTNFFQYGQGVTPPGTYNHPRDFFNGLPPLKTTNGIPAKTPMAPVFDTVKGTYTIPPAVDGVEYHVVVEGYTSIMPPGTHQASAGRYSIKAVAASGYELGGKYVWEKTFPKIQAVFPTSPVFNDETGRYTIRATPGVIYLANGSVKAAGTYPGNEKAIAVTAKPAVGYTLLGDRSWTHTFAKIKVKAANPFISPGHYYIEKTTGVTYYLDGTALKPGEHIAPGRLISITAKAHPGFQISGTLSWKHDYRKTVTPFRPDLSGKNNRYTIPARTGVTYYVDGKAKKAGTYSVSNGKMLTFTTKASSSAYRLTGRTSWSFRF